MKRKWTNSITTMEQIQRQNRNMSQNKALCKIQKKDAYTMWLSTKPSLCIHSGSGLNKSYLGCKHRSKQDRNRMHTPLFRMIMQGKWEGHRIYLKFFSIVWLQFDKIEYLLGIVPSCALYSDLCGMFPVNLTRAIKKCHLNRDIFMITQVSENKTVNISISFKWIHQ